MLAPLNGLSCAPTSFTVAALRKEHLNSHFQGCNLRAAYSYAAPQIGDELQLKIRTPMPVTGAD